ncbi:MAG TPA: hypothetical protein VF064_12700 [Pyrinomonadaceae bacterium]
MAAKNNHLVYVGLFMAAMGFVFAIDTVQWLASYDDYYAAVKTNAHAGFTQKVRVVASVVLVAAGLLISIAAARGCKRLD